MNATSNQQPAHSLLCIALFSIIFISILSLIACENLDQSDAKADAVSEVETLSKS